MCNSNADVRSDSSTEMRIDSGTDMECDGSIDNSIDVTDVTNVVVMKDVQQISGEKLVMQ